jgi:lactate dehydrogenase-like 2-hydroxyacid dehydrogenase
MLTEALDTNFTTHKLYEAADPAGALVAWSDEIRGMACSSTNGAVDAALIDALPRLEIIANMGVGTDGIDLAHAKSRGIPVTNTPDVLNDAVADTAMALLLNVTRRMVAADAFVRSGEWLKHHMALTYGITGKTCGIVGMGRIGQAIAKRAEAFGMEIAWHGPRPKPELSYRYFHTATELARASDVLILALPGGPSTRHAVNAEVLEALGPQGYLVNIARGSVVDEPALIEALKSRSIAGAGLDVFENEPDISTEFFDLDNVVLAPHIGSATRETRKAMGDLVVANLLAHFEGRPLLTPVT